MITLPHDDHRSHARRLRDRAAECRALAGIVGSETAPSYLQLAAAYEELAAHEELMRPHARIEDVLKALLQRRP